MARLEPDARDMVHTRAFSFRLELRRKSRSDAPPLPIELPPICACCGQAGDERVGQFVWSMVQPVMVPYCPTCAAHVRACVWSNQLPPAVAKAAGVQFVLGAISLVALLVIQHQELAYGLLFNLTAALTLVGGNLWRSRDKGPLLPATPDCTMAMVLESVQVGRFFNRLSLHLRVHLACEAAASAFRNANAATVVGESEDTIVVSRSARGDLVPRNGALAPR